MLKEIHNRKHKDIHNQIPPPPLGSYLLLGGMRDTKAQRFGLRTIFTRYTNFYALR